MSLWPVSCCALFCGWWLGRHPFQGERRCASNVKLSGGLIYRLTFPEGAQMTIGDECGTR